MSENLLGMNGMGLASMRESSAATNAYRSRMQHANALTLNTSKVDPAKLRMIEEKAQEFESVFLSQMLEYGFQDISSNPLGDKQSGFADDTYRSMLLSEYGKKMAQAGGIGIADHVKQTMLQAQEVTHVR